MISSVLLIFYDEPILWTERILSSQNNINRVEKAQPEELYCLGDNIEFFYEKRTNWKCLSIWNGWIKQEMEFQKMILMTRVLIV